MRVYLVFRASRYHDPSHYHPLKICGQRLLPTSFPVSLPGMHFGSCLIYYCTAERMRLYSYAWYSLVFDERGSQPFYALSFLSLSCLTLSQLQFTIHPFHRGFDGLLLLWALIL